MPQRQCRRCQQVKPLKEFSILNKAAGRYKWLCRLCDNELSAIRYRRICATPAGRKAMMAQKAAHCRRQMAKINAFLYEYLREHPCVDCGEADPVVLHFDHVRGKKYMNVSRMIDRKYALCKVQAEVAKCDVRCANCHLRRTARQRNSYRYQQNLKALE